MERRNKILLGGVAAGVVVLLGLFWAWHATRPPPPEEALMLPVPPVPPRIAEGKDYEDCLAMLTSDPLGAHAFAEAWEATGGGVGATHCLALSEIALGNAETGAGMLEQLGAANPAPDAARPHAPIPGASRAIILGQAVQAWLMAGDASHAFGDATLALMLSPDDPDLLIDRSVAAATLERYQDAVTDLDHALALDPHRADALVYRAAAWRELGDLTRAEENIEEALALDPDNADALLERGILRQRYGDLSGARADWQRAETLAPDTPTSDLAEQNIALLDAGPERP